MTQDVENEPLVNRVAQSSLITLNLEAYLPKEDIVSFDLKNYLFRELLLREKDFREALKEHDWTQYAEKGLAVHCSSEAIIPQWAYMLVSAYATPHAKLVYLGSPAALMSHILLRNIDEIDGRDFEGKRVVVKGCSDKEVPTSAYLAITNMLQPHAQSIMYGEPCSTVPIFKRPRKPAKR